MNTADAQASNLSQSAMKPGMQAACLLLFWVIPLPGDAQGYFAINGNIDVVDHPRAGAQITNASAIADSKWSFQFNCIVGSNEWSVENNAGNGIERIYCDGTNLYKYLKETGPASDPFNGNPPLGTPRFEPYSPSNDTVTINIFPGTEPIDGLVIDIPWLAFCSGRFLRNSNRVVPLPTAHRDRPDALGYSDNVECFENGLGLPRTVELFTSKQKFAQSVMDPRLHRNSRVMYARLHPSTGQPDGKLKFRYQVSSITNFEGFTFAQAFSFSEYNHDSKGRWYLETEGTGRLLSINDSVKPTNVFAPGHLQSITDWRFRSEKERMDAIRYFSKDVAAVPSTNDPALQIIFLDSEHFATPRKAFPHWILMTFMGFLIFSPAIIWAAYRAKKAGAANHFNQP